MSREPQISVIVPMYNAREFIEECVGSILAQSMEDFELLLLDDGSTDGTLEFCRCLYGKEGRVRLFANGRNMGPGLTRNRGMGDARGKYIAFVDADDFLGQGYLTALWEGAEDQGAEVTTMGFVEFQDDDGKGYLPGKKWKLVERPMLLVPDVRQRIEAMLRKNLVAMAWGKLFRREFLMGNRLRFEDIVSEDVLFHFAVLYFAGNYLTLPDTSYCYRQSPSSITRGTGLSKTRRVLKSAVLVQRHLARYLSGMPEILRDPLLAARIRGYFAELFWDPVFFDAAEGLKADEVMALAGEVFMDLMPEDAAFVSFFFQKALLARSVKAAE